MKGCNQQAKKSHYPIAKQLIPGSFDAEFYAESNERIRTNFISRINDDINDISDSCYE